MSKIPPPYPSIDITLKLPSKSEFIISLNKENLQCMNYSSPKQKYASSTFHLFNLHSSPKWHQTTSLVTNQFFIFPAPSSSKINIVKNILQSIRNSHKMTTAPQCLFIYLKYCMLNR